MTVGTFAPTKQYSLKAYKNKINYKSSAVYAHMLIIHWEQLETK